MKGAVTEPSLEALDRRGDGFSVDLDVYQGPFDVLLSLLANRKLELTEVSLASVTGEFLAYVNTLDFRTSMDQASSFLDVASVLVEAKSAALLPVEDETLRDQASMEALRERDLLFARLLQYRAFKEAGQDFRAMLAANSGRYVHPGRPDDDLASLLPDLEWATSPQDLALLAATALANAPVSQVSLRQLHVPLVNLNQQADLVRTALLDKPGRPVAFASIIATARGNLEVVARFLAVLVYFMQQLIQYKQEGPYEPLYLRWVGSTDAEDLRQISEGDFA